ncbi:phosphatidylinositol kinase-related protein kinase tor1 [Thecaphora frezii]
MAAVQKSEAKGIKMVMVALEMLGKFDFQCHILNKFVRNCTLPYLENDHAAVQKMATKTCMDLFVNDPICYQTSMHAIKVVNNVLDKLMTVGIANPNSNLRWMVLNKFGTCKQFDCHLVQSKYICLLFIALNNTSFKVHKMAIIIIGQLAKHNPAYMMPSLQKVLIQLLTELKYSTVSQNKEEAAKLLTDVVHTLQHLVKLYTLPMLKVLLPKASDASVSVLAS